MSQHDYNIANQTFPSFRSDLNNALGAIHGMNSGSTAPSTTTAYMLWADTTNSLIKMRNTGNSAWISLFKTDGSQVFASSSSVSEPAFSKSDDTNTGVYFPTADQVGIACGGTLVASFNTTDGLLVGPYSGPYGIGNNSLMTIRNNTNDTQLQFHADANGHYITVDNYPDRSLFICNNCSGTGTGGAAGKIFFQNRDTDGNLYTNLDISRTGIVTMTRNGFVVGSPTSGNKGAGAINAEYVFDDNTLLTCYVFDKAIDGDIDIDKWDDKVPNKLIRRNDFDKEDSEDYHETVERIHEPLRKFKEKLDSDYNPLDIDCYAKHWKDKRHLTSMPNEEKYDPLNGLSSGEWVQRLIETVEIQAIHIEGLNQRLKAIEA